MRHLLPVCSLPLLFATLCGGAHAEDDNAVAGMTYVSLDAMGDNADSRDLTLSGSVGFANHYWVSGSVGKLDDSGDSNLGDLQHQKLGFGLRGAHWSFQLDGGRHRNDAEYSQRDLNATLGWRNDTLSVGVDGMQRRTTNSQNLVRSFPALNLANVPLRIDDKVTGHGVGAHVDWNVTDALALSLGGMSYSYDQSVALTTTLSLASNVRDRIKTALLDRTLAAFTSFFNSSGTTRSLALLDSSVNVGVSYEWESVQVSAQYIQDKALGSGDKTDTVQLGASFFVGDHLMLAPLLGRSSTSNADDVTFGGLSVSYNW